MIIKAGKYYMSFDRTLRANEITCFQNMENKSETVKPATHILGCSIIIQTEKKTSENNEEPHSC